MLSAAIESSKALSRILEPPSLVNSSQAEIAAQKVRG
jgi:hypothetical protein